MPSLAVCASEAVCTTYPCFSRSQRRSFTFISLSSTMRMHSPGKATSVSLRCLPPRQERVQLPQQGGGTLVSLHHHCLCGLTQPRLAVVGEVLQVPDHYGPRTAGP